MKCNNIELSQVAETISFHGLKQYLSNITFQIFVIFKFVVSFQEKISHDVFDTFSFFLTQDEDSKYYALKAIGNVCIRHYELMLGPVLKTLYHQLLKEEDAPLAMKVQVGPWLFKIYLFGFILSFMDIVNLVSVVVFHFHCNRCVNKPRYANPSVCYAASMCK